VFPQVSLHVSELPPSSVLDYDSLIYIICRLHLFSFAFGSAFADLQWSTLVMAATIKNIFNELIEIASADDGEPAHCVPISCLSFCRFHSSHLS
jgi:hypothetical protein